MKQIIKNILIVEDDISLHQIWENFFKYRITKVTIEWAVSCEEAIKIVRRNNENNQAFFLIITDIFLAGSKTGLELIKSPEVIASNAKTILVSAVERKDIIEKLGYSLINTIIIAKPIDFEKHEVMFRNMLSDNPNETRNIIVELHE